MRYTKFFKDLLKKHCNLTVTKVYKDTRKKFVRYKILFYGGCMTDIQRISMTSRTIPFIRLDNKNSVTSIVRKTNYKKPIDKECKHCKHTYTIYKELYSLVICIYI